MTTQDLCYDRWLEEALRSVVRRALTYAADHGLPGTHHFYVTFVTAADGVELAPELRAKYPDEMTIVLQHQFWDPALQDDIFSVTLKFRGRLSRIVIPLAAITAFGDPSVNFGLQLKPGGETAGEGGRAIEGAAEDTAERTREAAEDEGSDGAEAASAKVIALDTFRKK